MHTAPGSATSAYHHVPPSQSHSALKSRLYSDAANRLPARAFNCNANAQDYGKYGIFVCDLDASSLGKLRPVRKLNILLQTCLYISTEKVILVYLVLQIVPKLN